MKLWHTVLAVSVMLVSLGMPVRAAAPITIESDWTWDLFYTSHTGVTSATDDIAQLNGLGVSTTPYNKNVVGFSWSVLSVGADSHFTVSYPTKTFSAATGSVAGFNNPSPFGLAGGAPIISTTTRISVIAGYPLSGNFETMTMNPVFTWSNLSAAATTYVWISIGRAKNR